MDLLFFWIIMAVICGMIASGKNKSFFGFFIYGLLIWPIALVHILISDSGEVKTTKKREAKRIPCPECAELIMPEAKVCRFCQAKLEPLHETKTQNEYY